MADCFITRGNAVFNDGNNQYFTFSTDGIVQYPSVVKVPNTVTSLGNDRGSFRYHSEITGVTFENGCQITELPTQCFNDCTSLKEMLIPESVVTIGTNAFDGCSGLESVTLPSCTIKDYAFQDCGKLQSITINGDIKLTGIFIFQNCNTIDSDTAQLVLSKHTGTQIGSNIFKGCTGIASIETDKIGNSMFFNCTSLTSAKVTGHNCTKTPSSVFSGCTSLTDVTLENITSLGTNYFQNCSSLTTLTLPSTITNTINKNVFTGCSSLTELCVENGWNCTADFSNVTLSEESVNNIIGNLKTLDEGNVQTLTFNLATYNKIADESILSANAKGWNLTKTEE